MASLVIKRSKHENWNGNELSQLKGRIKYLGDGTWHFMSKHTLIFQVVYWLKTVFKTTGKVCYDIKCHVPSPRYLIRPFNWLNSFTFQFSCFDLFITRLAISSLVRKTSQHENWKCFSPIEKSYHTLVLVGTI
jgi:hypothetical protein